YPLTIDPIFTLQQRLAAADGSGGDFFGHAVALSGNTALVGAPYDNQSRGSAYVFVRNGAVWTQQARLFAQDGGAFDYFGGSVALKGDTALVGAVYGPGSASSDQGAAYVFFRVGTSWNLQQKLNANENTTGAQFGASVALDGNTALVGAFSYALPTTNNRAGAAFVFTRSNSLLWTQQARLTVAEGEYDDYFGIAVALEGDTALIGAPRHTVTTASQGAAYVFIRNGTSWALQQRILNTNPEANERFGNAVALSGENALIGAYFSGPDERGAAYSFRRGATGQRGATEWTQTGTLLAPNPKKDARLGISVALSGDTAVVGAARGLFDTGDDQRSAYVFVYSGEWLPVRHLGSELGAANDGFGYAVALEGETVLIGAYRTAVTGADQGAAYVLTLRDSRHAEQQKLIAADGKKDDYFGSAVALAGDTLIIAAVGTNSYSGAVYVFTRTGTPPEWRFQQKLTAPDGAIGDNFGEAVALSGNTLLVGAPFSDGRLANQGAVYPFTRTGTLWQLAGRPFTTSGTDAAPNMHFGQSIALHGDLAVIGAPGLNNARGAVFVFTRASAGASWTQQTKFSAEDGTDKARLGESVALAGNTVAAGAPYDTINGNKDQGSVSLFDLNPGTRQLP
ncbi:MAG TPA: FG-GAP repeat protein, partial [Roseiflexaceae bacterium]|nr:FG-GAP repeat protein [Roseiflexaceae bacterium]